jgi:hypothetical protein
MQRPEVSNAVLPIYRSLGVNGLNVKWYTGVIELGISEMGVLVKWWGLSFVLHNKQFGEF